MAKLFFYHGTMGSAKSTELLTSIHKYEEQGKTVWVFKPSIDTRSANGFIESRTGLKHECIDIEKDFDFCYYAELKFELISYKKPDCIFIDEASFLTKEQVKSLRLLVDTYDIPVCCYGLKNTYIDGKLFEGAEALLFYADKIGEIKNVCEYCNRKSIMNLRVVNGQPIYNGETINIGDTEKAEDYYVATCSYHYFHPRLNKYLN